MQISSSFHSSQSVSSVISVVASCQPSYRFGLVRLANRLAVALVVVLNMFALTTANRFLDACSTAGTIKGPNENRKAAEDHQVCRIGNDLPAIFAFRDLQSETKLYGFVNRLGEVKIEPSFTFARDFVDGLAAVMRDGKWEFIDESGSTVVSVPDAQNVRAAHRGVFWFQQTDSKKWGLRDLTGKTLLEPTYDVVLPFSEGLSAVNLGAEWMFPGFPDGGRWGFVDTTGQVVIPVQYDSVQPFSEGLAYVSLDSINKMIDPSGNAALQIEGRFFGGFSDGLLVVHSQTSAGEKVANYINRTGELVLSVNLAAGDFYEGLAAFSIENGPANSNERRSYGFINKNGEIAIPAIYAEVQDFSEGLAGVRMEKTTIYGMGDTWGYIDKSGKMQIEAEFNEVTPFREGCARVHIGGTLADVWDMPPYWIGGEWWLIDTSGKRLKRLE